MAASAMAGSSARRPGARQAVGGAPAAGAGPAAGAVAASSGGKRVGLGEGGLEHPLLAQGGVVDLGGDAAAVEDVDAVAVVQLLGLGRVEQDALAGLGLGADAAEQLALGADVDPAHRVVEQEDVGPAG